MKYLLITISLFAAMAATASATPQSVFARITVYWRGESCQRASWNGAALRNGHCAVDPKRIPYGSKVIFPDTTCTAVDTGTDVVNRKAARLSGHNPAQKNALVIDRYFDSKSEALAWSRNHPPFMTVQVQTPDWRRKQAAKVAAVDQPAAIVARAEPEKSWGEIVDKMWEWGLNTCTLFPTT